MGVTVFESWSDLRPRGIVHEDEHCLVFDKPPGISVVGERHGADLVRLAKEDGEVLRPAHRIDKLTSGLVVIAKTPEAHAILTRQFAKRTVVKTYIAVVNSDSLPAKPFTVNLPLRTASSGQRSRGCAQVCHIVQP